MLKDIPFVEAENTKIDILVGRDVPALHQVLEDRFSPSVDTIHACRSIFGWYLAGPSTYVQTKIKDGSATLAWAVDHEKEDALEKHLSNLEKYDFDDPVYNKSRGRSRDDIKAQRIVDASIRKVGNKYSIALPWKDDFSGMPDNRTQAERRLKGLIPQLRKCPEFHKQFAKKWRKTLNIKPKQLHRIWKRSLNQEELTISVNLEFILPINSE